MAPRHPVHPVHMRTSIPASLRYTVHPVHKKADTQGYLLKVRATGFIFIFNPEIAAPR